MTDKRRVSVYITAELPQELAKQFMQHVRDFDAAHIDCTFHVVANAPDMTNAEALDIVQMHPPLANLFFARKQS